jgi:biopolymer transport protein ExbD
MNWLKSNTLERRIQSASLALLTMVTAMAAVPRCSPQELQKGISVELAPTGSAVPEPEADDENALMVTVTGTGGLYLGVDPVTPDGLAKKLERRSSDAPLFIKADARAPYASVVKVLDAARTAGVTAATLLTASPKKAQAGTKVFPEGIEIELARSRGHETAP